MRNFVSKLLALHKRNQIVIPLSHIQISRADNNQKVSADIVRLESKTARSEIDETWWNLPDVSLQAIKNEGDHRWIWEEIVQYYGNRILNECVAILSQEQYLEGAMIYHFNAKSKLKPDEGSLYIERVSSAPRNRNWLVNKPLYKGIGTELLIWAVKESYNAGLGGRVLLESLPTPSTVLFYENKGFIRTDLTQASNRLVYYELSEVNALKLLKKGDLP